MTFGEFFKTATGGNVPHNWQSELGSDAACRNRLIRIPTGMGKTLGVLLAWLHQRHRESESKWPRRLVWCLPIRTLVEQTAREATTVLERAGFAEQVDVHCLMGGNDEAEWYAEPERPAILIGTQDILLSRALNRGYAMGRAAWPRAFGLINSDTLWVMDEVQLMGVGLTSSAQIQSFWESASQQNPNVGLIPRSTWWMSATLQPDWLSSPETESLMPVLKGDQLSIAPTDRLGPLWNAIKPVTLSQTPVDDWAKHVVAQHDKHEADAQTGRQTLVVVNTVKRAKELLSAVDKELKGRDAKPETKLIHSRFRPFERQGWAEELLSRKKLNADVNRILIATQVVEAGVDISASCLMTELAPWPSLVQRFGRAARYGGRADVVVLDHRPDDDKKARPYQLDELNAARDALQKLSHVSIKNLEEFETQLSETNPQKLKELYPFRPLHVLMQHEFEELFDTSPDLSGADMDVSRFIRESEEDRDVQIFWRDIDRKQPAAELQPLRAELCSVSIFDADTKQWFKKITAEPGAAWVWDYVDGRWAKARAENLRPGIILLVSADVGGYDPDFGFTGEKRKKGDETLDLSHKLKPPEGSQVTAPADLQEGSDSLSQRNEWKTIVTHCNEAAQISQSIASQIGLGKHSISGLLALSLRLHDWGKAHPAFATGTYRVDPLRADLAKAPKDSWRSPANCYDTPTHGPRKGFRHELASCLATLELLRQVNPSHPAIMDENDGMFAALREFGSFPNDVEATAPVEENSIADELRALSEQDFNLLLFLIASHHGKVRLSLQASPKDQEFPDEARRFAGTGMPIRGVREGDVIPAVALPNHEGATVLMPEIGLSLAVSSIGLSARYGPSWSERMLELVNALSPFWLGYLEAIARASDGRASDLKTPDPLLPTGSLSVPQREVDVVADENTTTEGDSEDLTENEAKLENVDA
ncbi:MAG: DEAD/DEAH box helicase [Planctomycetaceae bacterium]